MQSIFTSWVVSFLILCLTCFNTEVKAVTCKPSGFAERLELALRTLYINTNQFEEDKNVCPIHCERQGYDENFANRCAKNALTSESKTYRLVAALYNSPFPFYATLESHAGTRHLLVYFLKNTPQDALYLAFCDFRN